MNFKLNQTQTNKIALWESTHRCSVKNEGAIGGKVTFSFTPTSLGVIEKVKCACTAQLDVTDYESW